MNNKFVDNPLAVLPDSTVRLYSDEVDFATQTHNLPPWGTLDAGGRRQVARLVLANRSDPLSKAQLAEISVSNPRFNTFVVTQRSNVAPTPSPHADFLSLGSL